MKLTKKEIKVLREAAESIAEEHDFCCLVIEEETQDRDLSDKFEGMFRQPGCGLSLWPRFKLEPEQEREAQLSRTIALLLMAEIGEYYE